MKDIALITFHGMGKVEPTYFKGLQKGLKKSMGPKWDRVSFQNVQYAPILQGAQEKLWKDIISAPNNDVDSTRLRQFFLYGFGDAGSLEYSAHSNKTKYLEVEKEIQRALGEAFLELGQDKNKHVVIIAHSLGCQVISNYLWDAQSNTYIFKNPKALDEGKSEFLCLKSLQNLVTICCNFPLFIGSISDRRCFSKPNAQFRWDNYYDPDDILGWPLKQLGTSFNMVNDHAINAGGIFTSWNAFSHTRYWSDDDVIGAVANILQSHIS